MKRIDSKRRIINGFRWLGLFLVLLYAYWLVMSNFVIKDFWDPSYALKFRLLSARIKEHPGHPVWMIMGTSRVDDGLRAGVAADRMKEGNTPVIFNFGFGGAGIYRQFVCLRRIIKDGVKPQRAGIEIIGAGTSAGGEAFADDAKLIVRARRDEIGELCRFGHLPGSTWNHWLRSRLDPFFLYGMSVPRQTRDFPLMQIPGVKHLESDTYDDWGWYQGVMAAPVPPDVYAKKFAEAWGQYKGCFAGEFAINPEYDRDLRLIIDLCKKNGIELFLFKMPESEEFQTLYTPQANAVIDGYLRKIQEEYGVETIDARPWLPGRENYMDGHHLNANGAEAFSRLFMEELLKQAEKQGAH